MSQHPDQASRFNVKDDRLTAYFREDSRDAALRCLGRYKHTESTLTKEGSMHVATVPLSKLTDTDHLLKAFDVSDQVAAHLKPSLDNVVAKKQASNLLSAFGIGGGYEASTIAHNAPAAAQAPQTYRA